MVSIAIELQNHIITYMANHLDTIPKADQLSTQDWNLLRTIAEFLEAFKSATLKLESRSSTLDQVLHTMDILKKCYSETLVRLLFYL